MHCCILLDFLYELHANRVHNFLRKYTYEYLLRVINYVKPDCRTILSNKQTLPDLRNFKLGNFRRSTRNFNQMSSKIFLAGMKVQ